jgi:cyclase
VLEVVRKAAEEIFMPFTVGGGVKSLEDIRLLLGNGADKVSINTEQQSQTKLGGNNGKSKLWEFCNSQPLGQF